MIRTVIYGGSFDPVHKGHEEIISRLSDRFDEVLVVPTYISPFKQGNKVASASLRMEMLRSCHFKENVTLSDYEINKEGCSYSIDTVKHFSAEGRELYFAIGSEGARSIDKWRCSDELKKLCEFYVIKRPGFTQNIKGDFINADFCGMDISSSEVKVAIAFGKPNGLVSDSVAEIIKRNGLYDDYAKYTEAYKIFGLKNERIEHTYRATLTGIKLAKRYDESIEDSTIALILHDIGKYVTPEKMISLGIPVPDCVDLPESCVHAEYGAAICEHYFKLKPEIVEAVRTHTTCGPNMGKLGEIVALADYIEPGREFDGLDKIRKAAAFDLTLAVKMMLENTINYLSGCGQYIAPITIQTYDKYAKLQEGNKWNKSKK